MDNFEIIAKRIFNRCKELYWEVPNTKKNTQIRIECWNIQEKTAHFLYMIAKSLRAKEILELGTSAGYSTLWLAKAAKEHKGSVDTIENFKPKCEVAKKHFKEAQLEEYITLHEDTILNVLKSWNKDVDMIFMDANRSEYDQYFYYLYPLLKKGGVIIVDNAQSHKDGLKKFLELCKTATHQHSIIMDIDNGLFVFIK